MIHFFKNAPKNICCGAKFIFSLAINRKLSGCRFFTLTVQAAKNKNWDPESGSSEIKFKHSIGNFERKL